MLRSMSALLGFTLAATDGDIGGVEAFYFDDTSFTVRHLVVAHASSVTPRPARRRARHAPRHQ